MWSSMSRSSIARLFAVALFAAGALGQAPDAQERDLKFVSAEEVEQAAKTAGFAVPRSYALVVGIADYESLPREKWLRYSERDADAIYNILISPEGGNFRAQNVHRLTGKNATLSNLRRELEEWLPSVAEPQDRVLIYFAGHGFVHDGRAYLAPHDVSADDIAGTGYAMDDLGKVIGSSIKANNKVLLTDSCHSGAITPQQEEVNNQLLNRSLMNLDTSLFSLTASRDRESSFESPDWGGGHGIFTYYVVKGLEGEADENADGIVTADELAEYARANVRQATEARQTPTSDRGSFDSNMPIAYVPEVLVSRTSTSKEEKFGALIFETNRDGVEIFVDGKSAGVVDKAKPLRLPGLRPGPHTIKGVKQGYEPDGPREEIVYPGQEKTVSIKILYARRRNSAAVEKLDKGIEFYNKGFAKNYRKASALFREALALDANYSTAALYLGRSESALFEYDRAAAAYQKALDIDPDYLEARAGYGGMLLDVGDFDEAIRQLAPVVQRDPEHQLSQAMLSQAYRMKDMFPQSIEAARIAIRLNPQHAEPYLFLADSLRLTGSPGEAEFYYERYLELSDFESSTSGKVFNYWVRGFLIGGGKKRRAGQKDIWNDLRSLAYFGLGDCARLLKKPDPAITNYQRALSFDEDDPQVHWALGLAFTTKAELEQSAEPLAQAKLHFENVIRLNEHLEEAEKSRKYIAKIDTALAQAAP